jgi:hypothetical protein
MTLCETFDNRSGRSRPGNSSKRSKCVVTGVLIFHYCDREYSTPRAQVAVCCCAKCLEGHSWGPKMTVPAFESEIASTGTAITGERSCARTRAKGTQLAKQKLPNRNLPKQKQYLCQLMYQGSDGSKCQF